MQRTIANLTLLLVLATATSCSNDKQDGILAVRATATVVGVAFVDRDGDAKLNTSTDGALPGVAISLQLPGSATTVARATSQADGTFLMSAVPVGTYHVAVDSVALGDSLRVVKIDKSDLTLTLGDTAVVTVMATYPTYALTDARKLPLGRKIFVKGVAVSSWSTFADSTLYITAGTASLRAANVRPTSAAAGDSVRLLGTTALRDGQPVLIDVTTFVISPAQMPAPTTVTTSVAAKADAGRLDAAQVQIVNATILSGTLTVRGDLLLTVNDGSGRLDVFIDRATGVPLSPYVPGALLSASGVLVPAPQAGTWRLKPRLERDMNVDFPDVSIADARALAPGKRVGIRAVALNSWALFADTTLHVADRTGAIRALHVRPLGVFAGDSVRFVGTIGFRDGQPALLDVTSTILATASPLPAPRDVNTATAKSADDSKLDAALARIAGATVTDTATTSTGLELTVQDASGTVQIVLDPNAGFTRGLYNVGNILDIVGLLVPREFSGSWQLKPRGKQDVVVKAVSAPPAPARTGTARTTRILPH
jgi:hypothetical protein